MAAAAASAHQPVAVVSPTLQVLHQQQRPEYGGTPVGQIILRPGEDLMTVSSLLITAECFKPPILCRGANGRLMLRAAADFTGGAAAVLSIHLSHIHTDA